MGTRRSTGKRRRLHKEELYDLYSSSDIFAVIKSRGMRWAGHAACMGKNRDGETWSKRPFGRPRRRCEDDIKMNRQGPGRGGMDLIHLAQDIGRWQAHVNMVMKLRFP
jgi:hypothetical protein